jgi:hypothetical protein
MNYDRRKDMTKKKWLELQKQNRATNGFNTGTRDMKSEKYPTREKQKALDRKEIQCYN